MSEIFTQTFLARVINEIVRMFIPVGQSEQFIWRIDKKEDGSVEKKQLFGVRYVPLTDA